MPCAGPLLTGGTRVLRLGRCTPRLLDSSGACALVEMEVLLKQERRGRSYPLQGWPCERSALEDEAPLAQPPGAFLVKTLVVLSMKCSCNGSVLLLAKT